MSTKRRWLILAAPVAIAASWGIWALASDKNSTLAESASSLGRAAIEVCVAVSPAEASSMDEKELTRRVSDALDAALLDPRAADLGVRGMPRTVVVGCPQGYVAPPADVARDPATVGIRRIVNKPSPTSTFVFVVSDAQAGTVGPRGFARAPYEATCDPSGCMEVSTAVFVTAETLSSPDSLRTAMVVGLGIDPTGGEYPDGRPPGATSSK